MTILRGTHDQVAHAWANKLENYQQGSCMFRDGDTVYSYGYHFPIARHITLPSGKPAIMLTNRHYSSSTSSHRQKVCTAIPYDVHVFHVHNPLADAKHDHRVNYGYMSDKRAELLKVAERARSRREEHLDHANILRFQMNTYTSTFKLGYRNIPEVAA